MPATELTALLPLEPPPMPPPPWWSELLPLAVVVLVILGLLWWWRRPASRNARRLRTLQRSLARANDDTRAIAAELEQLLRDATGHAHPASLPAPRSITETDWQTLLTALQQARFQHEPAVSSDLQRLLPLVRQVIRGSHA